MNRQSAARPATSGRRTTSQIRADLDAAERLVAEQRDRIAALQADQTQAQALVARLRTKVGEARALLDQIEAEHRRQVVGLACRCGMLHPCPTTRILRSTEGPQHTDGGR